MSATEAIGHLHPQVDGYLEDPHERIADLREAAPVHWSEPLGAFIVLRYEDVHPLVRDRHLTGSVSTPRILRGVSRRSHQMMLGLDGGGHLRLRRLVSKAFTPRAIESWRATAEGIIDGLLAAFADRDSIDVVADYAQPLPVTIISTMLGVPMADIPRLREWSRLALSTLDPFQRPEDVAAADAANEAMSAYFHALVADKRHYPADDIIGALIRAEEAGDCLDEDELVAQIILLYVAGHETTAHLISNGVLALLQHPDQRVRLCGRPEFDGNAVEEVLRFEGPAMFTYRLTHAPLDLQGVAIPAGSLLMLSLAGANRDPRWWGASAGTLDIARDDADRHVGFGGGPHLCLGAALARLEATLAIPKVIRRFPAMHLVADRPTWHRRVMLRGLESLRVRLR